MINLFLKIKGFVVSVGLIILACFGFYSFGKKKGEDKAQDRDKEILNNEVLKYVRAKKNEIKDIDAADAYIKRLRSKN